MLYKLTDGTNKAQLEPLAFQVYPGSEKDLENMLAANLLEILFEDEGLMPIFQERQRQPEADIYALDKDGNLVIFELKLGPVDRGAALQVLRYAEHAGRWSYDKIKEQYRKYKQTADADLARDYMEAFGGEEFDPQKINNKQRLFVVGSAADNSLVEAVNYWKGQGLTIDFLPYRIYQIGGEEYFEFFTPPYDRHPNPDVVKGVLFDTNRSYYEDDVWYMMENSRVAARGDAKRFVGCVNPGDTVFFYHKGEGVVAAGKVKKGGIKIDERENAAYQDVEMLTPVPKKGEKNKGMQPSQVKEVLGKGFYWARTIKVPYLSSEEADTLLEALQQHLGN